MAFGQDFLKSFFGNDYVKDYRHASNIFRSNGYENAPRLKFLFHVYFTINTDQIPQLRNIFSTPETSTIGLLVKSIDLPSFKFDVEYMNQYNRKRLVQKKIDYQPVTVKLHDDGGDLIRSMWYNYFAYYYKDPNQKYTNIPTNGSAGTNTTQANGFGYNNRDIYANDRAVNDWGYIGEAYQDGTNAAGGKPPFFRDITIYGMNQHKFVQYTLINPLITDFKHDTYDYEQGDGVMENTMTINYETVKYYTGAIGGSRPDTNVEGFGNPEYYDMVPSPLSRPGGTRSVLGQGGLLDAGIGIIEDLQTGGVSGVIGAVQKAGTAYETFRRTGLTSVAIEEGVGVVQDVLRQAQRQAPAPAPGPTSQTGGVVRAGQSLLQNPQFPLPPRNNNPLNRVINGIGGPISNIFGG